MIYHTSINNFTSVDLDLETPNCHIEFDEFTNNEASFNLFSLNRRMYDNNTNVNGSSGDYLFSLNSKDFVFYNISAFDNPTMETPRYPNIQTGNEHIGSDNNSVIIHDFTVDRLTPNFSVNCFYFGIPNETSGTVHQPQSTHGNPITVHYEGDLDVFQD